AIGPGCTRAADTCLSGFHSRVGAAAMNGLEVPGYETTVALHCRTYRDYRIVIRIGKRKLFRISRHDSDRPPGLLGEATGDGQIAGAALAAEVSADGDCVDANTGGRKTDSFG